VHSWSNCRFINPQNGVDDSCTFPSDIQNLFILFIPVPPFLFLFVFCICVTANSFDRLLFSFPANVSKIFDWYLHFFDNLKRLKLSHYTPRRHLGGKEVYLVHILDLGTKWGWVISVAPRPRFSRREMTRGTYWTGVWVGPRAGLDTEARGKIFRLRWGSNLNRLVVQPVARHWWSNLCNIHYINSYKLFYTAYLIYYYYYWLHYVASLFRS
jgi:hypothetical protein